MASEKQIAANRANAKRSTGPKTRAGKKRSSQNALQHGLSLSLKGDDPRIQAMFRMVSSMATASSSDVAAFAVAQADINRIRQVRHYLFSKIDALSDSDVLRRLLATERYERRALTRRRRASSPIDFSGRRGDTNMARCRYYNTLIRFNFCKTNPIFKKLRRVVRRARDIEVRAQSATPGQRPGNGSKTAIFMG